MRRQGMSDEAMTPEQKAALWRKDLLNRLSPTVRPRIEGNPEYEELVALLAAWLEATDEHLVATENHVVTRLSTELAPGGTWKFPVQTLAIPKDLRSRQIEEDTYFQGDGGIEDQWRPCGEGWTRTTELAAWEVMYDGQQGYALVCTVRSDRPSSRLLLPGSEATPKDGQQLAFVCGDESLTNALVHAQWGVQHPGERHWQAVRVIRYQDYLRLERGLGGARSRQRQLAAWLPPFYPYSRKFLRFSLTEPMIEYDETEWGFLGEGAGAIRLAARIDKATAGQLKSLAQEPVEAARNPLIFNAVPVVQMQSRSEELLHSPFKTKFRIKEGFLIPYTQVWGAFAATVRETYQSDNGIKTIYPAAGLRVLPVEFAALRQDEQSAEVTCGFSSAAAQEYHMRLYFGSRGQDVASPRDLSHGSHKYLTPFPALGGKDAPIAEYGDAGARHAWYHTYLRAPQPTASDIIEILSQMPCCYENLVLSDPESSPSKKSRQQPMAIQLDIENHPQEEQSAWENYLWPTLASEETFAEMRTSFLSASKVAIVPRMRLHFKKKQKD